MKGGLQGGRERERELDLLHQQLFPHLSRSLALSRQQTIKGGEEKGLPSRPPRLYSCHFFPLSQIKEKKGEGEREPLKINLHVAVGRKWEEKEAKEGRKEKGGK